MKIQYGMRTILILVLAAGMFMSGWVANDSYRTLEAKRKADEAAKQARKISNMAGEVRISYNQALGAMSFKGDVNDVKAVEKFLFESKANDAKAAEKAFGKLMPRSKGK